MCIYIYIYVCVCVCVCVYVCVFTSVCGFFGFSTLIVKQRTGLQKLPRGASVVLSYFLLLCSHRKESWRRRCESGRWRCITSQPNWRKIVKQIQSVLSLSHSPQRAGGKRLPIVRQLRRVLRREGHHFQNPNRQSLSCQSGTSQSDPDDRLWSTSDMK